jgi:3-dehydroquinate dehydratase-1
MICVAISESNLEKCLSTLDRCELAEIRLDLTGFNAEQIKKVFSHKTPTIATCRPEKSGTTDQFDRLTLAIESGACYVDIEIEMEKKQRDAILEVARKQNCKIIISYHNFEETPALQELSGTVHQCFSIGADIAKVTTMVKSNADNARLLSLFCINKPLVVLGMGEQGKITRIMAPFLGAEFTFAAMDDGEATAPGQIKYSRMKQIIEQLNNELKSTI